MNIHINKKQYLELKKATILSIKMGSQLYGCQNKDSDTDILHIFASAKSMDYSYVWTHHNFQYKENGVDHVFTSIQNYIRNLINGDSTINYECLFSQEMQNFQDFQFIYDLRHDIKGYNLQRAYLGLARRDLKIFSQQYDTKKLFHAIRGIWAYDMVKAGIYSNDLKNMNSEKYELLMHIKNGQVSKMEMISLAKDLIIECDDKRKELSLELDSKKVHRIMDVALMAKLDSDLIKYCHSKNYQSKVIDEIIIESVYAALENDVQYN